MRTIFEIKAEHSANATAILTRYHDATDQIRATRDIEDGTYRDQLTDEQRLRILRENKRGRADEAYRSTRYAYAAEVDRYQDELDARATHVKKSLFGMSSPRARRSSPGRP